MITLYFARQKVIDWYWVAVGEWHVVFHSDSVNPAQSYYSISITVGTGGS